MSNTRDILIASREAMDTLVPRLNSLLDLAAPLTIKTVHGEGTQAAVSWDIAEGALAGGPIALMDTEGLDLDPCWRIEEDFWQRCGWYLSIDVRWRPPESCEKSASHFDDLTRTIVARVGQGLAVPCVALSNLQTPLGSYP